MRIEKCVEMERIAEIGWNEERERNIVAAKREGEDCRDKKRNRRAGENQRGNKKWDVEIGLGVERGRGVNRETTERSGYNSGRGVERSGETTERRARIEGSEGK